MTGPVVLTPRERRRLAGYDPDGYADDGCERNFCHRMQELGLLDCTGGDSSGGRAYEITDAGRHEIAPLRMAAFDPSI